MIYILLLVLLIVCWTLNPFLKKVMTQTFTSHEFLMVNNIVMLLLLSIYYMATRFSKKLPDIELGKLLTLTPYQYTVLVGGSLMSLVSALVFLMLIKMEDISKLVSISQSITIIASIAVGCMFFNEKLSIKEVVGIMLMVAGITIIKYKTE
jgi:uncharacterized membrane protein